jgi:hypothetical protein
MAFSAEVRAGSHRIGAGHPPFVIAEMSGNHNGDLDRALAIVDAVADSGAQALKIQTYTADTITIDADGPAFRVEDAHGLSQGHHQQLLDLGRRAGGSARAAVLRRDDRPVRTGRLARLQPMGEPGAAGGRAVTVALFGVLVLGTALRPLDSP